MEKLKMMMNDFIKIKNYFYWINYYKNIGENKNLIDSYKEKIELIYQQYQVHNISDIIFLIENEYHSLQIEIDSNLMKNIIFSINQEKQNSNLYDDKVFRNMYIYYITNNLYNPNWLIGVSEEPLYVLLPVVQELLETNLMVYSHPEINWQILNNETDAFMSFVYKYINSKEETYKKYYLEIIKLAVQSSIDIESTIRYKSLNKNVVYQVESIQKQLSRINDDTLNNLFMDKVKIIKKK